jgi:hypothetical protein
VIGTLLCDRYHLEEKVGSGGMSSVYLAFDETLERWVAIKVLHREISSDPDQIERFRREARAVARLSSPYVVTVIDAGEDEGHPFIVFEYVEGETLKDRIRRVGRLPVGEAIAYAIEIGRALMAAHAERLVHRDVKPQNVLLDGEGRAKVTDFGIARSLEVEGLTATGRVLGTTDYVAPEQALGEEVTAQSDIYSLGVVLYEMLTGDVPFRAESQVGVAMKHVKEPLPDVRELRPEVSAALASVIERATAKETRNRYQDAEQIVDDLEHALAIEAARSGETTGEATTVLRSLRGDTADVAPLRLRRPGRWILLTLLVAVAVAAIVVGVILRGEQGTTGGAVVKPPRGLQAVSLESSGVQDYDPQGDDAEHGEAARNAIDGNRGTLWDTETYQDDLSQIGKTGVGLVLTPTSPVAARRLDVVSSQPGYAAEVLAANGDVPDEIGGWTKVGEDPRVGETAQISLDTNGRRYDHYLFWITKLPPEENQAAVSELTLLR